MAKPTRPHLRKDRRRKHPAEVYGALDFWRPYTRLANWAKRLRRWEKQWVRGHEPTRKDSDASEIP